MKWKKWNGAEKNRKDQTRSEYNTIKQNITEYNKIEWDRIGQDITNDSRFSHDVTKIQTKKQSLLLSFYFHVALQHLKTFMQTNFRIKRVLRFAVQDV